MLRLISWFHANSENNCGPARDSIKTSGVSVWTLSFVATLTVHWSRQVDRFHCYIFHFTFAQYFIDVVEYLNNFSEFSKIVRYKSNIKYGIEALYRYDGNYYEIFCVNWIEFIVLSHFLLS